MSGFIYYYAKCHYAECRNGECRYAECRGVTRMPRMTSPIFQWANFVTRIKKSVYRLSHFDDSFLDQGTLTEREGSVQLTSLLRELV
jgi:hypothetical protein